MISPDGPRFFCSCGAQIAESRVTQAILSRNWPKSCSERCTRRMKISRYRRRQRERMAVAA